MDFQVVMAILFEIPVFLLTLYILDIIRISIKMRPDKYTYQI